MKNTGPISDSNFWISFVQSQVCRPSWRMSSVVSEDVVPGLACIQCSAETKLMENTMFLVQ